MVAIDELRLGLRLRRWLWFVTVLGVAWGGIVLVRALALPALVKIRGVIGRNYGVAWVKCF